MGYDDLEAQLREYTNDRRAPIFLPYLTGVNPPDYFPDARGAFLDLDLAHGRIDLAYAVEEGVAHLLRRNVEYLTAGTASRDRLDRRRRLVGVLEPTQGRRLRDRRGRP